MPAAWRTARVPLLRAMTLAIGSACLMPFKKMVSLYHIPALCRILTLKERHGHDLEIENQTPIFHVPDVVVNPFR